VSDRGRVELDRAIPICVTEVFEQDHEFVAAHAADQVGRAHCDAQQVGAG